MSLRTMSPTRSVYEEELAAMTPLVMARARHLCEAKLGGCWSTPMKTPHHRKRRSQRGPNTLANLIAVCLPCHTHIHANPAESYDNGLLIRGYEEITPLGVR